MIYNHGRRSNVPSGTEHIRCQDGTHRVRAKPSRKNRQWYGLCLTLAWGVSSVGSMDELRELKAVVMCPGCDAAMKPIEQKPITEGLVDVTYRCEKCQMTTIRTVRPDDQTKV